MATPSQAEIETYWKAVVDCLEDFRSNADGTLVGNIDTAQQAMEGDYIASLGAAANAMWRARLAGVMTRDIAAEMLTPVVLEYGKFVGSPGAWRGDVQRCLRDLYVYWHANTRTLKSRNFTHGAASAVGSPVGTGSISRLTVDENNYRLESCTPEVKTLKCIQDGSTGARRHEEVFELRGTTASIDTLASASHGSGLRRTVYSHHAGTGPGGSLLRNCAFADYNSGGTTTTKFPGWTVTSSASNVTADSTVFRGFPGSSENTTGGPTPQSIKFTADDGITQKIADAGFSLDPSVPYFLRVMLYRQASATGTVTLSFGSQTVTQALGSLTNTTWTELAMTIGQKNWPKYVDEANLDIGISVASLATGTFLAGDILFAPFDAFDGTWWFVRGGATAWALDDAYTFTDTGGAAADAKLQYWLQWAFPSFYLPSTTGTPTVSDP